MHKTIQTKWNNLELNYGLCVRDNVWELWLFFLDR